MRTVLDHGKLKKLEHSDAKYSFATGADFLSPPTNLIPAVSSVSGPRILIGDKAANQAISLVHREVPLVQSAASKEHDSFEHIYGRVMAAVEAKDHGTVTHVDDHSIKIKDANGKEHEHELYHNFNLGRKSFLHHTPAVAVGDKVKKGQIIATSNYSDKNGNLALGINLRTAIMPYRSANFEDAFVVSEAGAKKLVAEQLIPVRLEKRLGIEANKDKFISLFANKFYNEQLATIDSDGVVKKGTLLHTGDPIILAFAPRALRTTDIQLGKLHKALRNAYRDNAITWDYEHPGLVTDVVKTTGLITVNVKTERGLAVSDKISNLFGSKGVVGSIVPDAQMPTGEDGKPVDLILNAMSITSRVAPAIPISMALGKVAQKTGKPLKITPFVEHSSVGGAIDLLKKHKISEMEKLYDPVTGQHVNVFVGPLYVTRLVHISEDKLSGRSQGIGYDWNMQPTKSEEESAKRIGNLSTTCLLSHGATQVLKDMATIRATKNDEYWRRLKLGLPLPTPEVPFVFHKFISSLQGAGIKVHQNNDIFQVLPMTDKDIAKLSTGPIHNALTFKIKKDQMIPEEGGLFDPAITGVLGNQYNHINLHMSVPNPISEDFLRRLLGLTKKDYLDQVVSGEINKKLQTIDIDQEIAKCKQYLKTGKKTEREDSVKVLAFLNTLKTNKMHPKDLILTKIPVIPAQFRPAMVAGDLRLSADVNNLYKDLILNNLAVKNVHVVPDDVAKQIKLNQYAAVKAVYGMGDPIAAKNKEKNVKGLLSSVLGIHGGSGKGSFFQAKVVNKPLDLVGRAVLTPDSKLGLDEASVPQELLWKTYGPFVIRNMIKRGIPATQAKDFLDNRNPIAVQALQAELQSRPGIVSRDPALHKYNLTGFLLKPNSNPKDHSIKLNPLVFKSFNADNDGDQLNISVPVSETARQEILDKMLPSKNLISPRTFNPMYVPSNEAALGLFQAQNEKGGAKHKFKTEAEVEAAFMAGKLKINDEVEITE